MKGIKLYLIGFFLLFLLVVLGIIYKWGFWMLVRLILGLGFLGLTLILGFFLALALYAKNWKFVLYLTIPTLLAAYATYLSITWQKLNIIGWIAVLFILGFICWIWYTSEPELGLLDRFKSPETLEKEGNYRAAARKYEKRGNYLKAAEMYEKLNWMESAAWAYKKARRYEKAAKIYEQLYERERDTYYLKEAYKCWKKAGYMDNAAKVLEKYAKEEPWFWEDVAKLYEKINNEEKAKEAWKKALEYYLNEAREEGVFWEDVGNIWMKLDNIIEARRAYQKFLEYCLKEAEENRMWWKHIVETYEILGEKEKAQAAWEKYEEYRKEIIKQEKIK